MKKLFFYILLAVSAIALNSCLEGYNDSTPYLQLYPAELNWRTDTAGVRLADDTLNFKAVDDYCCLDTIVVGDSVRFGVRVFSFANSLTSLRFSYDSAALDMRFPTYAELKTILDTVQSDMSHGVYVFLPGYNQLYLPISYITKTTGTSTLKIALKSDANPDRVPNEATVEIKQPVR